MGRGFALGHKELLDLHEEGRINDPDFTNREDFDSKVDPGSFDIKASGEAYRIELDGFPMFVPDPKRQVWEQISELPRGRVQKINLDEFYWNGKATEGFDPRHLYLIPAMQSVTLKENENLTATGSSTLARTLVDVTLLADYAGKDFVRGADAPGVKRDLWLAVTSDKFVVTPKEGIPLTQAVVTDGLDAKLTEREILETHKKKAILYDIINGELVPKKNVRVDRGGLELHLDLHGDDSEGVIALKARDTMKALDLSKRMHYNVLDFYDPILASDGNLTMEPGVSYLYRTEEMIMVPTNLLAHFNRHDARTFVGPSEKAGLVNPGDKTALVYEATSHERNRINLRHGMGISSLGFFRFREENPEYECPPEQGGYKGQMALKPAKIFADVDWKEVRARALELRTNYR